MDLDNNYISSLCQQLTKENESCYLFAIRGTQAHHPFLNIYLASNIKPK